MAQETEVVIYTKFISKYLLRIIHCKLTINDSTLQLYHERGEYQGKRHINNMLYQKMYMKVGLDN